MHVPSQGQKLRDAMAASTIMIPGAFNALTARMAERLGYSALYLSGGALAAGWAGVPDIGLLTSTEFVDAVRAITRSTGLPLLCDADTGFGGAIHVERTVQLYEGAGAAGLHLEDQELPKRCGHLSGKTLVRPEMMAEKIRAAVSARRDRSFVIVARTDARGVEGFDRSVARALAYVEAGADMIFPEALETPDEFAAFCRAVHVPLVANMTEFGRSPLVGFDDLAAMGYRAVLYPLTAFRTAMKAAFETLIRLKATGTQTSCLGHMLTRAELYELLEYSEWEARDAAYFGGLGQSN